MDWNDLRHFVALARNGSVRAAGAQLGVSHTTVARRVEALEAQLGTRLFDRHRDGYVLTAAGRRMLPAAERVEDEVAALGRGLVGQDARLEGPLRLTCGDEYLAALLLDDLAPWCAENPGVELTLVRDERFFNLAKGEADLAVRVLGAQTSPPDYLVGLLLNQWHFDAHTPVTGDRASWRELLLAGRPEEAMEVAMHRLRVTDVVSWPWPAIAASDPERLLRAVQVPVHPSTLGRAKAGG
jgi:DNA-binding transcriptional LysR family regulator